MARKQEQHHRRTFNVSVVGLCVSEHEKGPVGVGKSCLCNRFVRPLADDYYTDHISVLSQSDFGGRVVNNDHFLFWGDVTKTSDDGTDMTFNVVEQTEFIDDSSFQPFKCGKSTELYYKRCADTKLQSAEKLMYICKNQLGLEHEYEQKLLPDGRLSIDGFLFVFSVAATRRDKSGHDMAEVERQVDYNCRILSNLVKTKKPVVLVTSKNDTASDNLCRGAERLITRKEFKNANIPIVETSSHHNINVELAFLTVAHLIDRTKGRPKTVSYAEAARTRIELLDVAKEAFRNLLRVHVVDYKASWSSVHKKLQRNPDYVHFVEKVGSDQARILFRKHVAQLKEEIIQRKQDMYLEQLQTVLPEILPDLSVIADRSWPSVCRWLQRQDIFAQLFVVTSDEIPWHCSDLIDSDDPRIPFDLMDCPAAETCFRNHVNALRAEQKRTELQRQFKQLLIDKSASDSVCAGQSLSEVVMYLLSRECFSMLSEDDKHAIYEQHQRELREQAKQNFIELQLEKVELFAKYRHGNRQVTREDLQEINEALSSDRRYKALDRLREDREVLLLNHLGFMERPSRERCPFREKCAECLIEQILLCKAHRPQSWNQHAQFLLDVANTQLSLVLLGTDGLANQLVNEIRMQCSEDEYMMDEQMYSLDYRPIEGDVSLPQNAFCAASFMPQGCFCVFNSLPTLEYLRSSLERTLISDLEQDNPVPYQGLPTVIILAHNPNLTEKGLMVLREEGQNLCDRLQCPFIDIPSSMMLDDGRRFNDDQIDLAMHELLQSIQHRSSFVKPWHIAESIEPDIRILMCFMCGDDMNLSYLLTPLLSHQCCFVTSDKFPTITLETYLGDSKRKVEVVVTSYHGASVIQDSLYHGFILVYSAKRKASLRTMGSFVSNITAIPTQIMAVSEADGASALYLNELTRSLLMEGRAIAGRLKASFHPVNSNLQQQTVSYTPFFKQCWDKKACTESAFTFACDENTPVIELPAALCGDKSADPIANRPPAALPTQRRKGDPFDTPGSKGSTNNSQSTDSEPVYDRPQLVQYHSDSEVSSASPLIFENATPAYSYVADGSPQPCPYDADGSTELYSEIPTPVYEDAFLRSHEGHTKRNLYTAAPGSYKKSPPPTLPKPNVPTNIKSLDLLKFADVRHILSRNMERPLTGPVKAPLATPEPIEISEYAQVRDAVGVGVEEENDYALVADALPEGKLHRIRSIFKGPQQLKMAEVIGGGTDSDSERSSVEREEKKETIYSRVHRKPTPHKKKHRPRQSDRAAPQLPPTNEHQQLIHSDQLVSLSEGSEETGDERQNQHKQKKKRSLRSKKKKQTLQTSLVASPPWSDSDLLSLPTGRQDGDADLPAEYAGTENYEDDTVNLLESGNWKTKLRLRASEKDKQRRKEERKAKEDEKRKQKEEKKLKLQKKMIQRKKDGGRCGPTSQNSVSSTLEDLLLTETKLVPYFIEKCVCFIEEEGLSTEGLYRVPGNQVHVVLLIDKFKEDPNVDIRVLDVPVNAVATALKQFLIDLSESLVPSCLQEELIEAADCPDVVKRRASMRAILQNKMPACNLEVLKYLVKHFHNVGEHSAENSMQPRNLAICWWPTLMRPHVTSFEKIMLISKASEEIIIDLIEHHEFYFGSAAPGLL